MNKETFKNLYKKRRTVRKFLNDEVPDDDIKYMIDAARLAPSGMNSQAWKFLAIKNKSILNKMAEEVDNNIKSFYPEINNEKDVKRIESFKFYYLFFKDAPLVVAALGEKTNTFFSKITHKYNLDSHYGELVDPDILSLGGAIENMILAAAVLGYGSAWMTGPVRYQKQLEKILNVEDKYHLASLIAIGKPVKEKAGPPKKSLDDVLEIIK